MTLDVIVVAAVLASAVLHASWNALTKASSDPLLNIAIVTATGGVVLGLAIPLLPMPRPAVWPYLAASVCLHFAYQLQLVRSYGLGDLSQVYPIARGFAPLGVAVLALTAGERPAPLQALGLVMASGAIASLALSGSDRGRSTAATRSALITAVLIAAYTFVDGLGVRVGGDVATYVAWSFFLDSFPIVATALYLRRTSASRFVRTEGLRAVAGGIVATLGYGLVLWALARGPMAPISALRETSVIFGAFIGTRILGEPFGARRVAAAGVLALGLLLVQS